MDVTTMPGLSSRVSFPGSMDANQEEVQRVQGEDVDDMTVNDESDNE